MQLLSFQAIQSLHSMQLLFERLAAGTSRATEIAMQTSVHEVSAVACSSPWEGVWHNTGRPVVSSLLTTNGLFPDPAHAVEGSLLNPCVSSEVPAVGSCARSNPMDQQQMTYFEGPLELISLAYRERHCFSATGMLLGWSFMCRMLVLLRLLLFRQRVALGQRLVHPSLKTAAHS